MKTDPTEAALARLDEIPLHTPEGRKQFAKALTAKSNLIAAKAARILGDAQWSELKEDLAKAFGRFVRRGAELDKGCLAMTAIARALYALDYDEPDPYLAGIQHIQMEPVWGGSEDTAAELRAICAMGLVSTRNAQTMRHLVDLLVDAEWQARAGAARALAVAGSEAAALLLRLKARSGDREPEVLADCLGSLIAIEGSEALSFVQSFASSRDSGVRQAAFLALGNSRRADAVEWLIKKFSEAADSQTKTCILLSLAASRTEAALDFVLGIVRTGSPQMSAAAVSTMAIHQDSRVRARVEEALNARLPPGSGT